MDFVCLKKRLVIEVDGKIHDQQKESDAIRTEYLNQLGFKVIRFKNEEIIGNSKYILEKIRNYLNYRSITQFSPPSEG